MIRTLCLTVALIACWITVSNAESGRRLPPFDPPRLVAPASSPAARPAELQTPAYDAGPGEPEYEIGYEFNRGVFLRSTDLKKQPFSIFVSGWSQVRYTGFTRDEETFTNSAGETIDIVNRNFFETERLRLNLAGTAIDPRVRYVLHLDGDSDGGANADVLFAFFQYDHCDALKVRVGRWRTVVTREWLLSARYPRLTERSIAQEFFRGGFTDGVWLLGDLPRGGKYWLSVNSGLGTSTIAPLSLDDNLAYDVNVLRDFGGEFGERGVTDFEFHDTPVVRVGASAGFSRDDDRSDVGEPLGDDGGFLRLSDGTLLAAPGALAPGVTVEGVNVLLATFDVGFKYRGWSGGAEYFLRSLQEIEADGPVPFDKLFTYGWRFGAGKFLVHRKLDLNFQYSQVSGSFGDAFAYSVGFNWYFRPAFPGGDPLNKLTFDVTNLIDNAETSTLANVTAGDDGQLFRMQLQFGF